MTEVTLYKPIFRDGEEVKVLQLDFDALSPMAFTKVGMYLTKKKYTPINQVMDTDYNNLLAGMAAGLDLDEAFMLIPKDKIAMAAESIDFFYGTSEDSSEPKTSVK